MPGEELYRNLTDDDNFMCPHNFAPVFPDEALASPYDNSSLKQEAEMICGDDIACLFDIAATGNVAVGQATMSESNEIRNDIAILGKSFIYYCTYPNKRMFKKLKNF